MRHPYFGVVHYIAGGPTWSVSMVYVSTALFAVWIFQMSNRLRPAKSGRGDEQPMSMGVSEAMTKMRWLVAAHEKRIRHDLRQR